MSEENPEHWAIRESVCPKIVFWRGDHGAAAVAGSDIWVASEYTAQTCTYTQYLVIPLSAAR
jgi:hypothetical protein